MELEAKLRALYKLRHGDEYHFIKCGVDLFNDDGVNLIMYTVEQLLLEGIFYTHEMLITPSRKHEYTLIRFMVWHLIKTAKPKISDARLAAYCNRKRLDARHGRQKIKDWMIGDKKFRNKVTKYELLTIKALIKL